MFDEYRDCLYAYKEALAVYTITAAQCTTCIVLQQCSMYMYMFRLHAHACVHVLDYVPQAHMWLCAAAFN